MPTGAVYVGRGSKWGNPWRVFSEGRGKKRVWICHRDGSDARFVHYTRHGAARTACMFYRESIVGVMGDREMLERIRKELRGRDLACWCGEKQPCHADVLLDLANTKLRGGE